MRSPQHDGPLLGLLLCSGAASLGYEALWADALALILGSDALASFAALAGYFAGLACGAAWVQGRLANPDFRPLRRLARFEAIAAVFALASPWLFAHFAPYLARYGPSSGAGQALMAAALLLPGTFCVGTIFPLALEGRRRASPQLAELDAQERHQIGAGRMYGAYTLGGVIGILGTAFVLIPAGGLPLASVALATSGLVAAALAWRAPEPSAQRPSSAPLEPGTGAATHEDRRVLLALAATTGFLGLAVEVIALRILGQVFSGTAYTFAIVVATMLSFTALGSAASAWLSRSTASPFANADPQARAPADKLFVSLVAGSLLVSGSAALAAQAGTDATRIHEAASFWARCVFEAELSARLLAGPAFAMGLIYARIAGAATQGGTGTLVALNSLGAALAPFAAAFVALPRLGFVDAWYGLALAYLGLGVGWGWWRRSAPRSLAVAVVLGFAALSLFSRPLDWVTMPQGWKVEARATTAQGVVVLARHEQDAAPGVPLRRLQVDQLFRMGGAWSIGERRMGAIAALLAPDAKSALFLGVGTGATAGGALWAPLERIDAVELVPEMLEHVPAFANINEGLASDPRVTLHASDARTWLARCDTHYDLIVGDLFHPGRDGAGRMFSAQHFEAVRAHLDPEGVYVQWLPLHQLDGTSFAAIVRAFLDAFEHADAVLGLYNVQTPALGLVGRMHDTPVRAASVQARLQDPKLTALAITSMPDLLAGHLCDRAGLEALAGDQASNDDLHPIVAYQAPRAGADHQRGAARVEALLAQRREGPSKLFEAMGGADHDPDKDKDYADAVALYLHGEILAQREAPPLEAAERWLNAYARAPHFALPRARLLAMADASPEFAPRLITGMLAISPNDPQLQAAAASLEAAGTRARPGP